MESLRFTITGEFVTETARDWFFNEGKPYPVVEELLLSCMAGTDIPLDKLKRMAQDVLLGRAEFVGSTADGSYNYVAKEDCGNTSLFELMDRKQRELDKAQKELNELTQRYLDLFDGLQFLIDNSFDIEDIAFDSNKEILKKVAYKMGIFDIGEVYTRSTGSSLLDSFLKADKFENNYGFIKPDGTFIAVEWGKHVEYGEQAVKENGWQDEFDIWYKGNNPKEFHGLSFESDFIVYEKGWVLLHSPAQGIATPTFNTIKGMTKAQKEFLFDYYIERKEEKLANQYWDE